MMQMSRLFEIIYILLSRKNVTARELAERFEVSSRTIYRDVDTLSLAGIPIYTSKGKGGGIKLLDEFVLDKSILSAAEQYEILSSLQSLGAVKTEETQRILEKLGTFFNRNIPNWIEVDYSDWNMGGNQYFHSLKTAIMEKRITFFDYYNSSGEKSRRRIEPVQLWFKHRAWYIKGFCLSKKDIRLFKLNRIKNLSVSEEIFPARDYDIFKNEFVQEQKKPPVLNLRMRISEEMAYRVFDEFEEDQIMRNEDGSFTVSTQWPEDEWVYGFVLSYGGYIEVLEPEHMREIIRQRLHKACDNYSVKND